MKKIFLLITSIILFSTNCFGEIKAKVYKNITFENINAKSNTRQLIGTGIIEITCDEEDIGSAVRLDFLKIGYITNKKNWLEIKKFYVEDKDKIFLLKSKVKHVNFYGVIDMKDIGKNTVDGDLIEGKYVGATPILLSIYDKELIKE
ncbi:hypothetical protein [Cetobacterium somerae]|uniref:hypothetical protein n=1 Tax=Cetobacterium somerae TaxID=188913 RepID=UPI00248EA2B4|nr:hypothetical protein [Cetobacterium somerae]